MCKGHAALPSTLQGGHPSLLLGGGKQGGEVTRCPRSPEEQGKHSNGAVCGFHTALPL